MSTTEIAAPESDVSEDMASRLTQGGNVRLRGKTRLVAHGIWIALFIINLVSFVVGIPGLFAAAEQVCPQGCSFVPQQQKALADIGVGMQAYATLVVALAIVIMLVSMAMGLLVFWRRPDDWMALIVALFLAVTPSGNISALSPSSGLSTNSFLTSVVALLLSLPLRAVYYGAFLIFPSGRFVPRWSWIFLVAWIGFIVAFEMVGDAIPVLAFGYLILYGAAIACQVYRYRYASNVVQRQQTKLVVVGFIASLLANQIFWQTNSLEALESTIYGPVTLLLYLVTLLALPFCFFLAIQRYRLYDIDVLIRRTLIYGSLTVTLAAIYLGVVIGLQTVINGIAQSRSGAGFSPPVIVVTTLLIAALFQPLRARIQRAVDRRFYRGKYDAQRAIEQFGASLRQQVDLPTLASQLVTVVQETMQPTDVSLWLAEKERPSRESGGL